MKTNRQIILDECRRFKTPFLTRRYEIGEGGKNGVSLTAREQLEEIQIVEPIDSRFEC